MKDKGKYQAWTCREFGHYSNLKLIELPRKQPSAGQVLIKVAAFAPGFPDLLMVDGKYQLRPKVPFTPCMEFSGTVEALGSKVSSLTVGERVMGTVRFGSAAQQVIAKASDCYPIPKGFDFVDAAGFLIAYKTAYVALISCGGLVKDDTVLIHGASGGVGLATLQLAKHVGARVIAVVSSQYKADMLSRYYADHVLVCPGGDFKEDVNRITEGLGADVVFDPIGGDVFDQSTKCIAPFGRLLVVGFAGGRIAKVATNHMLIKQYSVIGVRAGEFGRTDKARGEKVMKDLIELANQGIFRPHINNVLAFRDFIEAFKAIASRQVVGRVVVDVSR